MDICQYICRRHITNEYTEGMASPRATATWVFLYKLGFGYLLGWGASKTDHNTWIKIFNKHSIRFNIIHDNPYSSRQYIIITTQYTQVITASHRLPVPLSSPSPDPPTFRTAPTKSRRCRCHCRHPHLILPRLDPHRWSRVRPIKKLAWRYKWTS
jgi:hypothetical protein